MDKEAAFVQRIEQVDNQRFHIAWTDGKVQEFFLPQLQENCPCASCRDESTGERLQAPSSLDGGVRAKRILSVGRYALRVEFTSGCCHGIYDFDFLRSLGKETQTVGASS